MSRVQLAAQLVIAGVPGAALELRRLMERVINPEVARSLDERVLVDLALAFGH